MSMQSQDIIRRSATNGMTPAPQARSHQEEVAKLIDVSLCTGCKGCQVACSEWNDLRDEVGHNVGVYDNPADLAPETWTVIRFDEVEDESGKLEWLLRKEGCMHCAEPGCLKACPSPGAIVQFANGIVDFQSDQCIGCGYCVAGCPFDVPRISKKDNKAYKCTLCADRVAVGQEPACVKTCPTGAIAFGSKADMKQLAANRIDELKSRGHEGAGLYDPAGVGGTHVMYVLTHADTPEIYHRLPKDPYISPVVRGWKEWLKPVGALGFIVTLAASFAHYVGVGPNTTDEEDHPEPKQKELLDAGEPPQQRLEEQRAEGRD